MAGDGRRSPFAEPSRPYLGETSRSSWLAGSGRARPSKGESCSGARIRSASVWRSSTAKKADSASCRAIRSWHAEINGHVLISASKHSTQNDLPLGLADDLADRDVFGMPGQTETAAAAANRLQIAEPAKFGRRLLEVIVGDAIGPGHLRHGAEAPIVEAGVHQHPDRKVGKLGQAHPRISLAINRYWVYLFL